MDDKQSGSLPLCFAFVDENKQELEQSSSGGAFSAIARYILANGGVVYGCVLDDKFVARHVRVDSKEDLAALRGSKYVQSAVSGVYDEINSDLKHGRTVLFVGTPCQVGAVEELFGPNEKLISVDLVCHGVPSQRFFSDYLKAEFNDKNLEHLSFRDKTDGWGCCGHVEYTNNTKKTTMPFSPNNSMYYRFFLDGMIYRESCYVCPYASMNRPGDFTLGDFWGYSSAESKLPYSAGVSLLIVNSVTALRIQESIANDSNCVMADLGDAIAGNTQLQRPTERPAARDSILLKWNNEGMASLKKDYMKKTRLRRFAWMVKNRVKGILGGQNGR